MSFSRLVSLASLLAILAVSPAIAQPLGEQINQDQARLEDDRQQYKFDSQEINSGNQSIRNYIQETQSWIQNADAQAQVKQQQLNALEAQQKSKAMIQKLLNTPGSDMYVLNSWLQNEAAMRSQAQINLNTALAKLRQSESQLAEERYQYNADAASLQHDTGIYRQEMDQNADAWRQVQQGLYARGRHRYYTNFAESAYDSGRYNMGTGTWRASPREPQSQ